MDQDGTKAGSSSPNVKKAVPTVLHTSHRALQSPSDLAAAVREQAQIHEHKSAMALAGGLSTPRLVASEVVQNYGLL